MPPLTIETIITFQVSPNLTSTERHTVFKHFKHLDIKISSFGCCRNVIEGFSKVAKGLTLVS